jgi:uncharacterized delta-60 repeat protein
MSKPTILLIVMLLMGSLASSAMAQEDSLLPHGVVVGENGGCSGNISGLQIQKDGKILVSATSFINNHDQSLLIRRNADGSTDQTFGKAEIVTTETLTKELPGYSVYSKGLILQEDGKAVMAAVAQPPEHHPRSGRYNDDVLVIRYNADGLLDKSFNGSGWIKTDVNGTIDKVSGLGLQKDGKIIVYGYSLNPNILIDTYDFLVLRYNKDGMLDRTFGEQGKVLTRVRGMMWDAIGMTGTVQGDDKILVGGRVIEGYASTDMAVVRYMPNGKLDKTFGSAGKVIKRFESEGKYIRSEVHSIAVQNDGKIIVGVHSQLMRYNSDGSLDGTFGSGGALPVKKSVTRMVVQRDGKILFLGGGYDKKIYGIVIGRINVDGTPDTSFGRNGMAQLPVWGEQIAIQPNGKILVAARIRTSESAGKDCRGFRNDLMLFRLNADGRLDEQFGAVSK